MRCCLNKEFVFLKPSYYVVAGVILLSLFLNGCASTVYDPETGLYYPAKGVYHTVEKGETLWSIAKTYNVKLDDIVSCNKITNASLIEENERILIPGAPTLNKTSYVEDDPKQDGFTWPVRGKVLKFFESDQDSYLCKGIGIKAEDGQVVEASRKGKVVLADYLSGYDYTVILDHMDGYSTVYSLNAKLLVKLGDYVYKGEPIAVVGKKGHLAFLYFEIRKGLEPDNPLYYLPKL